jgi:hypothetical protein
MTPHQTLELRQSTIRQRLSELSGLDTPETEERSEMDTLAAEFQVNESRMRALVITETEQQRIETRTEDRQLLELEERASIGEIFDGARRNRQPTGATKELLDHLGMDGNYIPLSMFAMGPVESRAAATITGDVQGNQQPVVRAVFPGSVNEFLNIDKPTVPVGTYLIPVITTSATVHSPAEGAAAAESTGAYTVTTLEPSRLQSSFRWRREDAAKFLELESSLRDNLNESVMSALDAANLNHADGLLGANGLTARTGDASAEATFADHYGFLFDKDTIDGKFAMMSSDVKILYGPDGYSHAAGVYRGNSSDMTALAALQRDSGGVMTSGHVPAPATNDQAVIVRKGNRRDFSCPMWMGVEIVYDDISGAAEGELKIWAYLMAARKLLRADGFQRRVVQVA